ncbi:MAG: TrkH family potassium uptake protein [Phycisphaerales bacterium JB039]
MNYFFVLRQLARLLAALSLALLAVAAWSALLAFGFGDTAERAAAAAFAISGAGGLAAGAIASRLLRRGRTDLERREALLLVTLSWLVGAGLSGLPYLLWASFAGADLGTGAAAFASPVNCYFEAMSGLTTTGATILTGIDELPRSVLLWRATTHWIGGLGIVVLFVAVLPSVGVAGKRLFTVEAAGPSPRGVRPEVRETARVLLIIYSALTLALIGMLLALGMGLFDAICHAFATLATGGFATSDASIAGRSAAIQWILVLFMIAGGVNFGLYYKAVRRRSAGAIARDTELRVYLVTIALVALLCFGLLAGRPIITTAPDGAGALVTETGALAALRHATFQAASIHTTTGFCTADFDLWPTLAKGALVLLMFIGGCAGSTAGGIKVIRLWIALRLALAQIERTFRPSVVRPLRVGGQVVSEEIKLDTLAYILAFILLWLVGTGVLLAIEAPGDISFATAATASVSALGTIGPGLGRVGAIQNYAWMTDASKILLCGWMLMARLEIFPVIVLLSLRFWRE